MMGDSAYRYTLLQGFLLSVSAGHLYPNTFARTLGSHRILPNIDSRFRDDHYGGPSDFPELSIFIQKSTGF